MSELNLSKIKREIQNQNLVGDTLIAIKLNPNEQPFVNVDSSNGVAAGVRTIGAGLVEVPSKEYRIPQQLISLKTTAQAGTQSVAYQTQIDLSSDFFNGIDEPVLAQALYFVSGLAAATPAQRTVEVSFTDTAGKTFSSAAASGSNVNCPEFSYIIGEVQSGNLNLNDNTEIVVVPLTKLAESTTKIFTLTITYALPATAVFARYKVGVYKSPNKCQLLGYDDIIITNPLNISGEDTKNDKEMKGPQGEYLGSKQGVTNKSLSFETATLNLNHARILTAQETNFGGKMLSRAELKTIPASAPFELSFANSNNTTSAKDVFVKIEQDNGQYEEATIIEGGQVLSKNVVRYHRDSKKLKFSSSQSGKRAEISCYYIDQEAVEEVQLATKPKLIGDVFRIKTDSTTPGQYNSIIVEQIPNCEIMADIISSDISREDAVKLKIDIKQIVSNTQAPITKKSYKL